MAAPMSSVGNNSAKADTCPPLYLIPRRQIIIQSHTIPQSLTIYGVFVMEGEGATPDYSLPVYYKIKRRTGVSFSNAVADRRRGHGHPAGIKLRDQYIAGRLLGWPPDVADRGRGRR